MILELLCKRLESLLSPFCSKTRCSTGTVGFALEDKGRARAEQESPQGNLRVFRKSLFTEKLLRIGKVQITPRGWVICSAFFPAIFSHLGSPVSPDEPRGATPAHPAPQFLLGAVPGRTAQGFLSCRLPPAHPRPGVSHYFLGQRQHPALFPRLVLLAPAHPPPPFLLAGCCWAELRRGTLLCCNIFTAGLTNSCGGERWIEAGDGRPGPSVFLPPFIIPNSHPNQRDAARGGLCRSSRFCNVFKRLAHFRAEKCPQRHGLTHTAVCGGS